MNLKITAVHYHLSDATKEFVEKKLETLERHLTHHIEDLKINIKKERENFIVEGHLHFHWGKIIHVSEEGKDLYPTIEIMINKLKISSEKEKNKKQEKI